MSFEPPAGILDIGNATLRVGKLEVAETSGLNQGLQNIVKNDLLVTEKNESSPYTTNQKWGLKLPTAWVGEFEIKGQTGKYIEFNFYNEGSTSNAQGYTLNFKDTSLTLKYDNEPEAGLATATIPTIVGTFRKVNIFFERGVIAVSIDGARVLYFKESDTYNSVHGHPGVASRVVSTTGGAFVNVFIESDHSGNSQFKNLRIVNGRFISDKTSNVSFIGSLGVGVHSPKESLDIRGNMHFNRVSNVSQVSVDSNVVTEYTGPHDRPLRKYPEVPLSITSESASGENGYKVSWSSIYDNGNNVNERPFRVFDGDVGTGGRAWMVPVGVYGSDGTYVQNPPRNLGTATGGNSTTVDGEYIILQTPNKIKVKHFKISDKNSSGNTDKAAEAGKLYGSNDGSIWYELVSFSELSYSEGDNFNTVHVNATTYYDRLALVVTNSTATSSTYMSIGELEYYGYEKGSGSLDTTLKSVYNVPATTGTQLEVYYDAKDLATMPSTVTDLSPNTNGGSVTGVTLDETGGINSFAFNGTSQYITASYSDLPNITDHTLAFWMKVDSTATNNDYVVTLGVNDNSSGGEMIAFNLSGGTSSGKVHFDNWGSGVITLDSAYRVGEWVHVVGTMTGTATGNIETQFIYVNGIKRNCETTGTSTLNLTSRSEVTIGARPNNAGSGTLTYAAFFDGSIANVRFYSKALNADQVKELYDYQKDYFLGSKSQVTLYKGHLGVGVTEPSGQLELAGDERIQEYPPGPMSDYDTHIPGHGVFKAYASTEHNTSRLAWMAFNDESGETTSGSSGFWRSEYLNSTDGPYNGSTGAYISNARLGSDTALGEYVVLQLPYKIQLRSVRMSPWYRTSSDDFDIAEFPKNFTIYGSNDGNNWYSVFVSPSQTLTASSGSGATTETTSYSITSNEYYKYFGLVVTETNYGNYSAIGYATAIGNLQYFGTPGPTTLDKGSLTLGRSLDVPRVSRYDVDTETPRPEKLLLDYDTTVNDSPTDISGRGNHGTFYNGTSYSPADKAFSFNVTAGAADYIKATDIGNAGGLWQHSVSLWFKLDNLSQSHTLWFIDANGAGDTGDTPHVVVGTDGRIRFDMWGTAIYSLNNTIAAGTWYHVVSSLSATNNTKCLYINGTLIATHTTNIPHVVEANATLWIGSYGDLSVPLKGKISNFKVYDTVLEPSEVQKLYRLGRTGRSMVISDTAVGIGKVPETQLDVRGNIYTSGCVRQRGLPLLKACSSAGGTVSNADLTGSNWYEKVFVNQGNCFDLTTGRFYVPVAGYYRMFFRASATSMNVRFRKNGSDPGSTTGGTTEAYFNQAAAFGNVNAGVTLSGSSEQLIYANVGDYLHLQVASITGVPGGVQHNVFTIYFVG